MQECVCEILTAYRFENPSVRANLARILNFGRLVTPPVDQGFEHGAARSFAPNDMGCDPVYHIELAIESGCNTYAAPLVFVEAAVSLRKLAANDADRWAAKENLMQLWKRSGTFLFITGAVHNLVGKH